MDMKLLLEKLAVARPNYSDALDRAATMLMETLRAWGVPFTVQEFSLRPWIMLILAVTLLALAVCFTLAVFKKRPVAALILALAAPALLVLEVELFTPVISWVVQKPGRNIVIEYKAARPEREIVLMAHYDSKTDFWDHEERAKVYRFLPFFFILAIALALWTFVARRRENLGRGAPRAVAVALSACYAAYTCLVSLAFGGFILVGDAHTSPGTVDNATSVTALMALAKDIHDKKTATGASNVTIVLTAGEEVNLQGADYYLRERGLRPADGKLPLYMVNVELAGQCGDLAYAAKNGVFLKFYRADKDLVAKLGAACKAVTGKEISESGSSTDDAQRFMAAGIPAVTIMHDGKNGSGYGGFHCEKDSMGRVDMKNLEIMVKVLGRFIASF